MTHTRLALLGTCLLWGIGSAATATAGGLLKSNPASAHVTIEGEMSLAGTGPLPVEALPIGTYALAADGPGLGMLKGRLIRTDQGILVRRLSGPTSLLVPPGLQHLEHGERRGWIFWGAGLASGFLLGQSQADIGDAESRRDDARAAYDRAVTDDDVAAARDELLAASIEVDDRREVRNLWGAYLAATWLGASFENWLLTPAPRVSRDDVRDFQLDLPKSGGWSTAFRSAIVPGAGQRSLGAESRANLFSFAVAVLGGGAILSQEWFLEARRDQQVAQARFDRAVTAADIRSARRELREHGEEAEDRDVVRWGFIGAAAGVYVWNVIDAFGRGGQPGSRELALSVSPASDGLAAAVTWSLP